MSYEIELKFRTRDHEGVAKRLAELAAEMARGELSQEAFPYVNPPTDAGAASRAASGAPCCAAGGSGW